MHVQKSMIHFSEQLGVCAQQTPIFPFKFLKLSLNISTPSKYLEFKQTHTNIKGT